MYARNLHTIKLGLETERSLLAAVGNPQDAFLAIHVAGTNGKGSVCALLAAILRAAGLRTGLYTSPHLCRFHERLRVDGAPISDEELSAGIAVVEDGVRRAMQAGERDATFFEFTTALAFHWFREKRVQVAVLETGMGGRLDATNVVTPVVSVITSIGLDHQAYLGDTVEKIAAEKAGIIKRGRPLVCGEFIASVREVIETVARAANAPVHQAAEYCRVARVGQTLAGQRLRVDTAEESLSRITCPLLGRHQLANAGIAVTTAQLFARETGLPIPAAAIRAGLTDVEWPARLQVLSRQPAIILDGAHNPDAMAVLRKAIDELREDRPLALLASFLGDKDAVRCLRLWDGVLERCWLVPLRNERAMGEAELRRAAGQAHLRADIAALPDALAAATEWAAERNGLVVIAGSLYLAGEVLDRLGRQP